MLFAIIIHVGATIYNFDHLVYKDLETCEYHREKIYKTFLDISRPGLKVECNVVFHN